MLTFLNDIDNLDYSITSNMILISVNFTISTNLD